MIITDEDIKEFTGQLAKAGRAPATIEQYLRCVGRLKEWLGGRDTDTEALLEYKEYLNGEYKPTSVNAAIAAINCFFKLRGYHELRLDPLKLQRKIFLDPNRELDRSEYEQLALSAKRQGKTRLLRIIQTIFCTGIRISELEFITVEAVKHGKAEIKCKGKYRPVIMPDKLCEILTEYAAECGIETGSIFITRNGNPVNRANIWHELKRLAEHANVQKTKVFAHNLRHLFARTYYSAYKDIVRLADILGHSSINTTRIYTMESGTVHRRQLNGICQI